MSASPRQYSCEPEILHDYAWACQMQRSAVRIAGALNFPTTQEVDRLWYNNAETQRIITIWSDSAESKRKSSTFVFLRQHTTTLVHVMTAPVRPKIGVQGVNREIFSVMLSNWCITQLMRVVPVLFSRSNVDTTPPKLDAYDFFHALCILRCGAQAWRFSLGQRNRPSRSALPVKWHREPSTDRLHTVSPISPISIEWPVAALTFTAALEPKHALTIASGGGKIHLPGEGAISAYTGTREMLYQFAGKLREQSQRTQLSVEYDEAEEGGNSSTKFAGIDGLVEQLT
ncbi:uncharacterized protein N7500_004565 [Penicillium coprophilum]|uniref:uncharacterized protein n=1 Tax=Penicillium coprophilum TaxID=36646 RepID=UPI00238E96BD|nr:uncharacterized protein N7500_004565 [Penicillium coprophilum]KAJ5162735.1 hypothetical protein N7500_004565 [Penicillium coprophilum]